VFFVDNLLVQIHFIVEMIWWTGLAPCEREFPFPGSNISSYPVEGCQGEAPAAGPEPCSRSTRARNPPHLADCTPHSLPQQLFVLHVRP